MHKNLLWRLFIVVAVVGGMGLSAYYMEINLGLDLRGGAEILYKVHTDKAMVGLLRLQIHLSARLCGTRQQHTRGNAHRDPARRYRGVRLGVRPP